MTNFTVDWFSEHIPQWEAAGILELAKQRCTIMEIGCMEGRSSVWMVEALLRHPSSYIWCIDPWIGDPAHKDSDGPTDEQRFDANIRPYKDKVQKMKGYSWAMLPHFAGKSDAVDLVYIDGDHEAASVMEDWVLIHRLLVDGAFVVFDDYGRHVRAAKHQPKAAIDEILRFWDRQIEPLHIGSQVILRWHHAMR